ncbi:MAG: 3'-5' exonuclease, partial [Bacteroidales bacterium]
ENWRSYPNIVKFNNSLFSELLQLTDLFKEKDEDISNPRYQTKINYIKEIYIDTDKNRDVKQEIPEAKKDQFKDFQGYVKLYIAKDKNNKNTTTNEEKSTTYDTSDSIESEEDDKVLQLVINDVNNLWEKGYKNIGILVRTNKEAVEVFKYILQNSTIQDLDFKIISDESISFANSDAVLWIVFTLYALQNGSNYARYMSEAFYDFIKTSNSVPYNSLMNNLENDDNFMAQNLYFKAEHLVNIIYKELDDKEKVFCMHFLQLIKNYQREHNNNEVMFIEWFLNNGVKQSLKITDEKNGVHISTIHKSKGLEYDAVIVPFINWTRNQNDYLWFKKPDICNSNIPAFLLKTSGDLANSQFADEYYMEKTKKYVDDLNLLYVALTRAKKVLIANIENQNIGKEIQKCVTNNFNIDGLGAIDTYKSINSNENFDIYEIGTLVNNTTYASDVSIENFQWAAKENVGIEIKIKKNYSLSSNEKIAHGVLMHDILRVIDDVDNWEKKADKILKKYHKTSEEIKKIKDNIKTIFEINPEVKNWFTNAQEIISERDLSIYKLESDKDKLESDKERKMYRPDKIFIYPDKVIVVDFKTGEKDLNE